MQAMQKVELDSAFLNDHSNNFIHFLMMYSVTLLDKPIRILIILSRVAVVRVAGSPIAQCNTVSVLLNITRQVAQQIA